MTITLALITYISTILACYGSYRIGLMLGKVKGYKRRIKEESEVECDLEEISRKAIASVKQERKEEGSFVGRCVTATSENDAKVQRDFNIMQSIVESEDFKSMINSSAETDDGEDSSIIMAKARAYHSGKSVAEYYRGLNNYIKKRKGKS